jgi:hypothetical protein
MQQGLGQQQQQQQRQEHVMRSFVWRVLAVVTYKDF